MLLQMRSPVKMKFELLCTDYGRGVPLDHPKCFEGQTQYDACGIELRTRIANETAMIEGKISPSTQRQREPHNFFARQQRT